LAGNSNFGGKFKFWWEIQILVGNSNFGGKFKFLKGGYYLKIFFGQVPISPKKV
jgi:hypothetical protein